MPPSKSSGFLAETRRRYKQAKALDAPLPPPDPLPDPESVDAVLASSLKAARARLQRQGIVVGSRQGRKRLPKPDIETRG
jgi:hypothetical protein